jgi:hypothetical protein
MWSQRRAGGTFGLAAAANYLAAPRQLTQGFIWAARRAGSLEKWPEPFLSQHGHLYVVTTACGRHFWSCRRCKLSCCPSTAYPGLYMGRTQSRVAREVAGTIFESAWTSVCGHNGVRAALLVSPPLQIISLSLDSLPTDLYGPNAEPGSWRGDGNHF